MEQELFKKHMLTLNLIWLAMIVSLILYAGLTFVIQPESENLDSIILAVMAAMGVSSLIACFVARKMLIKREGDGETRLTSYRIAIIAAMALAESIGLYGIIIYVLGGGMNLCFGFIGVGLAAMLITGPKSGELSALLSDD